MSDKEDKKLKELDNKFRKLLNNQGYGFQYAVIEKLSEIFSKQGTWLFEVAELPVGFGKHDTRIDFVLRPGKSRFYLISECKKVNPSFSDWCFVKAPYIARNKSIQELIIEFIRIYLSPSIYKDQISAMEYYEHNMVSRGGSLGSIDNVYQIGLEVKKGNTGSGENDPSSRNAIQNASGQVMKGLNGFVEVLPKIYSRKTGDNQNEIYGIRLMPAIFTTANLWVSDIKLNDADLASGEIPVTSSIMSRVPWLFYQFPVSPSLKNVYGPKVFGSFSDYLYIDSIRTIAVISYDGIDDFFQKFHYYSKTIYFDSD